nr:hypothetical protein [Tanacetum cinerariifolium]
MLILYYWVSNEDPEAPEEAPQSPGQAPPSPNYVPGPEYPPSPDYEDPKEDPAKYLADGGDDADDESSDNDDDEDDDEEEDFEDDDEKEENPALADSSTVMDLQCADPTGRLGSVATVDDDSDELVDTIQEIAPTTLEGVNQRVIELGTTMSRDTHKIHVRLEDAQDDRALQRGRVNMLFRDRKFHRHTAMLLKSEARHAREA